MYRSSKLASQRVAGLALSALLLASCAGGSEGGAASAGSGAADAGDTGGSKTTGAGGNSGSLGGSSGGAALGGSMSSGGATGSEGGLTNSGGATSSEGGSSGKGGSNSAGGSSVGLGGAPSGGRGGTTSGVSGGVGGTKAGTGGSAGMAGASTLLPPVDLLVPPMAFDDASLTVVWSKPAEYSRIAGYDVYLDGALAGSTVKLFYTLTGLSADSSHSITARSRAADGTTSPNSVALATKTAPTATVLTVTAAPYSAVGDGTTLNTAAIQKAIDACPAGGKVVIPTGTFKSGALNLKSNMTLQVDGTLKGSDAIADYPFTSMRFPYYDTTNYMGLVNAYTTMYGSLTNIRITGSGSINGGTAGSGAALTTLGNAQVAAKSDTARGDMITVKGVKGFYLGGVTLTNPAEHTIFISYSSDITVNGITANTYNLHNADGIDLAVSDNSYIFNSTFDNGDDCINLNAGTSRPGEQEARPDDHIRIFNNLTKRGHGGVVFGSFTAGWIQNVWVEDCTFDGTEIGLRFKTGADRGGGARMVTARDITMKNIVNQAILFDSTYTPGTYPSAQTPGVFQQIVIQNVTSTSSGGEGIWVHGLASKQHHDISMKNLSFAGSLGASLDQMSTSSFDSVTFTGSGSAPWKRTNTSGLTFTNCSPSP